MTMTDNPSKKRSGWRSMVLIVAVLLVLHELSAGPVGWVFEHRYLQNAPDWVIRPTEWFYSPGTWLRTKSATYDNFCDWYMHLWIPRR
jgi:hypothetical protein